jgi:hypothetical protein
MAFPLRRWGNDVAEDNQGEDFQDPQLWRTRADETRQKANEMASPELKERMLVIAVEYERLAELVKLGPVHRRVPNGSD